MRTVEILKEARALIADEKNWTQGASAKDAEGGIVVCKSEKAVCFCSMGAIERVSKKIKFALPAIEVFHAILPRETALVVFNDTHRHAEVLALFDRAIARAESEVA